MRVGTRVLIAAMGLCALGCFERELRPVNPCTTSEVRRRIAVDTVDTVDLLFMVDNSGSMSQEQDLLRAEIPRMITILASGNRDGDPELEFTPVRSMHVGIITSDLGAGNEPPPPNDVPSCNSGLGDDGILRNTSRGGTGCSTTYPSRVFDFAQATDDPATFAAEVGCVADLGTGGCGFEQQLEATLKALSPAGPTDFVAAGYAAPAFFGNTRGHAGPGGANEGFLRAESALAIVLLTDEEDCSVPAYELFYPLEYDGLVNPLNLRCSRFPGALHPHLPLRRWLPPAPLEPEPPHLRAHRGHPHGSGGRELRGHARRRSPPRGGGRWHRHGHQPRPPRLVVQHGER
jgi:hypothetical protein